MKKDIQLNFNNSELKFELRDDTDESVFNEIFKLREYRIAEKAILEASVILDVGAHAGFFTLYAHALNKQAQIYSIEPEDKNFEALKKHLTDNGLETNRAIKCALGLRSGIGWLKLADDSHNHELAEEKENETDREVKVYGLIDFLQENNIENVSLIKMDIEGGEYDVLRPLTAADFKRIKYIIMEYHDYHGDHHDELKEILATNGFGVQIFPSKFDKKMGFIFANNKRI